MSGFLLSLAFPPPPSLLTNAMSVVSVAILTLLGVSEAVGSHLQYSKFSDASASPGKLLSLGGGRRVSSRAGMVALYAPALVAALAALAFPGVAGTTRGILVASALGIHFFKRVLEALFVHRYSGYMVLDSVIPISFSYFANTVLTIYAQYLARGEPEPPAVDLRCPGVVLFLVGIGGNLYHHVLLAKLRKEGERGYRIPRGGLFGAVICPHYLFEIVELLGVSFVSQTLHSFAFTLGSTFYLVGRSLATRKWYLSKFENFPRGVRCLIPYVF